MKDLKELKKDIQRDTLIGIVISLRHERINLNESKSIAKEFTKIKFENYNELFAELFKLSKKYKVIRKVYVKYAPEYEYMKKQEDLKIIRNYIKDKDYEYAIEFARGQYGY